MAEQRYSYRFSFQELMQVDDMFHEKYPDELPDGLPTDFCDFFEMVCHVTTKDSDIPPDLGQHNSTSRS